MMQIMWCLRYLILESLSTTKSVRQTYFWYAIKSGSC